MRFLGLLVIFFELPGSSNLQNRHEKLFSYIDNYNIKTHREKEKALGKYISRKEDE